MGGSCWPVSIGDYWASMGVGGSLWMWVVVVVR